MSVLRRSHDHHRGLRAPRDATPSTNWSHDRSPDRHLVTASKPLLRKFVCLHCWSLAGGGTARSDIQLSSESRTQRAARDGAFPPSHQPHRRRLPRANVSPNLKQITRAIQIPIAQAARSHVPPARLPPLGGFPTPAASARGNAQSRPASENLHNKRHRSRLAAHSAGIVN